MGKRGALALGVHVFTVQWHRQEVVMGMMKVMTKCKMLSDVQGRSGPSLEAQIWLPKDDTLKWYLNDE